MGRKANEAGSKEWQVQGLGVDAMEHQALSTVQYVCHSQCAGGERTEVGEPCRLVFDPEGGAELWRTWSDFPCAVTVL